MKRIVLILPTFNEKDNIESLIEAIEDVCASLRAYKCHIIVVDDYSPDKTAQVVEKQCAKYKNITLLSKPKEGLGAAYMFAMRYALKHLKPDYFIQMDADWSHDPKLIKKFVVEIEKGADFAIGSRYIPGGSIPKNWGWHRKLFSIVGNIWVRYGLGIRHPHDWSSGFRMMRVEVMKQVAHGLSKFSGYLFQVAFLHRVKKNGFKVAEIPLVFVDRVHGKSKFPTIEYIITVSLYVINNSSFLKYLIIGTIGFTVQTLVAKFLILLSLFPGLAVGIGSFIAIFTNFMGNNIWTFNHKKIVGLSKLFKKFIHFNITSIGAVIIQAVVVSVGVYIWGPSTWFWLMVAAIVFLVIPYNFFIYNRFIWKH